MTSQLAAAKGMCWSNINLGLNLRVIYKAGLAAMSKSCQKMFVDFFAPANKPNMNRPTMNIRESSIRLFNITINNSIRNELFLSFLKEASPNVVLDADSFLTNEDLSSFKRVIP